MAGWAAARARLRLPLVPARRQLTKDAQKRLEALQQLHRPRRRLRIATHDLEIRGAGNLLGPDQSGHIAAVGFDLYASSGRGGARAAGEPPREEESSPDIALPVAALLPDAYLPDVHQRLFFYKRFAQASSEDELAEESGPRSSTATGTRPTRWTRSTRSWG